MTKRKLRVPMTTGLPATFADSKFVGAGPPPGAGACHRAGQSPDPLGATLPFQWEGKRCGAPRHKLVCDCLAAAGSGIFLKML
jgi:hypothetical protein